jgi:hypothetical protein
MKSPLLAGSVIFCSLLPLACAEDPVYACDLFSSSRCMVKPGEVYEVQVPDKALTSWTDFSHELYFHSKITPGMRVHRSAIDDWNSIKSASCHYRLSDPEKRLIPVEGELEGFRIDDDGIWCFDYFGSQLLKLVRANHIEKEKVDMALFPLKLEIRLNSRGVERLIRLKAEVRR